MMKYEQDFIYKTIPQLTNAINNLAEELKRFNDGKETSSANKVYVYRETCDDNPFGEEFIKTFSELKDAESFLKERVEDACGCKWEDIPDKITLLEDDTLRTDYVSIGNLFKSPAFWAIEEQEITK